MGQAEVSNAILSCETLDIRVGSRTLVEGLKLQLSAGDFLAVLGPNGVGKTLTLHALAGLRPAPGANLRLGTEPLLQLDRRKVAARLGLLLQEHADAFPTTVLEMALLGRHTQLGFWQWERAADLASARKALAQMDLAGLEQRMAATLSGGERRRLALATLLVQDPQLFLLDEPMNHLDPWHRFTVLETFAKLATQGRAIVASLHDPSLAARYASSVLLLHGDGRWQYGPTHELLNIENLQELYATPFRRFVAGDEEIFLPGPPA
jgi:iron complex transport system ATP-binding protein